MRLSVVGDRSPSFVGDRSPSVVGDRSSRPTQSTPTSWEPRALTHIHNGFPTRTPLVAARGQRFHFGCNTEHTWRRPCSCFCITELESQLGHGWFDKLDSVSDAQLESVGASLCGKKVANVTHPGDLWLKGDARTSVLTVIKEGFQVLETKGHHRIYVVDPAKAHSTTVHGNTVVINTKVGSKWELEETFAAAHEPSSSFRHGAVSVLHNRTFE